MFKMIDPDLAEILARVSNTQVEAIGEISILWNATEHQFAKIIWLAEDWDDESGESYTAGMKNDEREKLIRKLATLTFVARRTLLNSGISA
jgi:hypothetical protein